MMLAAAALAACGASSDEPRWISLTDGLETTPIAEVVRRHAGASTKVVTQVTAPHAVRCELRIEPEDWVDEGSGLWSSAWPGGPFDLGTQRDLVLDCEGGTSAPGSHVELAVGEFEHRGERLRLRLPAGTTPAPASLKLDLVGTLTVDGQACFLSEGTFGHGFVLWTGASESMHLRVPPRCRLLAWVRPVSGSGRLLRVRLDERTLSEQHLDEGELFLSIPLPETGATEARLTFELDGTPGSAIVSTPLVAPLEVGTYGRRPWPESRRDVVLFVADTLRSDVLKVYGGKGDVAPHLEELAERSVVFRNARSAASWTLPSISSVLTGVYPAEHGATSTELKLSEGIDTLPELFARHGYRTGAVTDGVFFSWEYGLGQGFESFSRNRYDAWSLGKTLEDVRAFLARDDGRPVFLMIHTFRVHTPYRTGIDEDRAAWATLMEDMRTAALADDRRGLDLRQAILMSHREPFRDLYLEGVRGLDQRIGELVGVLERSGLLAHGLMVFTADHGECFGEHEQFLHGGDLWDVKLRVPLMLHGVDLDPRVVDREVSLIDLGTTLSRLAGLPDPLGHGRSLLDPEERPVYAFDLTKERSQLMVCSGARKLILETHARDEQPALIGAYDLGQDPGETTDVTGEADWVGPLLESHRAALSLFLEPQVEQERAKLTPEHLRTLNELGYAGE